MNKTAKIVVVGSSNMDLVARTSRIPVAGETIGGSDFFMVPGGKGANQAVAAARLGSEVVFVAKLGKDVFGDKSMENFSQAGIDTRFVAQIDGVSSGVAMIAVDDDGRNSIVVIPGANGLLMPEDIIKAEEEIASAAICVAQLETPIETALQAAKIARDNGTIFILDPAPAKPLPAELLAMTDIIKPNEVEAEMITGVKVIDADSAYKAADALLKAGVKTVIVTLGGKGFAFVSEQRREFVPNVAVKAIDTTAAGDTFIGALAYCIAQGKPALEAAIYANCAAAISVTRLGAQTSMPTSQEVQSFIEANA